MKTAGMLVDESERLATLYSYRILDTEPEIAFEDLTELAAKVLRAPSAFISLVDATRQWFKSACNTDVRETTRDVAFCAHAVVSPASVFVVEDTHRDPRFADNPLVTGPPHIRAYAGAVLRVENGQPLGTVCVIDHQPRHFSREDIEMLECIARQVVVLLEHRRATALMTEEVGKRRETLALLEASERRYRDLVEHAQGMICTHDLDGRLLMVNRATEQLLGFTRDEIIGRNLRELIAPEFQHLFPHYLDRIRSGQWYAGLLTMMRSNGRRVALAFQNYRVEGAGGGYVVGHGLDITERIRTEQANRRFAAILEVTPDVVGMANLGGRVMYLNRAARALCGVPPDDDLHDWHVSRFHSPEAGEIVRRGIEHAVEHGSWSGETTIRTHDGQDLPMAQTIVAPRNSEGQPEFIATIAVDISARKAVHQRVLLSERRLRQVIDNTTDVLFEIDAEGRWTFLSPQWTSVTGSAVEDALGQKFVDAVLPGDRDHSWRHFRALVDGTTEVCRYEARYATNDNTFCWMDVHARLVADDDETVVGIAGVMREVTMQRAMSEELVRAREAAEQAARQRSAFIAGMSHEVRTPLNGLLGLTAALLNTPLSENQRRMLRTARQSGETLLAIVNDLLDISKLEAGKMSIEQRPVDIRAVVAEGTEPGALRARAKGLTFSATVADDVPTWIVSDHLRLRQILLNLMDNAVRFTSSGTIDVYVTSEGPDGSRLRIGVSDTGIGIAPEKQLVIFEQFTQASPSTARQFGGSGLGLAICRELVTLMGGTIGLESAEGAGSTFWFTLPLRRASHGATVPAPLPSAALSRRLRVLVVDDNETNQLVARLLLEQLTCEVDTAGSGDEALERALERSYDAIFLDQRMPGMDGLETARRMRKLPGLAATPIVALTAADSAVDRRQCAEAGMTAFLAKPIVPETVLPILQSLGALEPRTRREAGTPDDGDDLSYDITALRALFPKEDEIRMLMSIARTDLQNRLAELRDGLGTGDHALARRAAHAIGGIAANVMAGNLADRCHELEDLFDANDVDAARTLSQRVIAGTESIVAVAERTIASA